MYVLYLTLMYFINSIISVIIAIATYIGNTQIVDDITSYSSYYIH